MTELTPSYVDYGVPIEELPLRANPPSKAAALLLIGLFWGLGTGFAHLLVPYRPGSIVHLYVMVGTLGVSAVLFLLLVSSRCATIWLRHYVGVLVTLHALMAALSGLLNGSEPMAIGRYVLLVPTMSLMLATVSIGPRSGGAMRLGLTWAGVAFILYHLLFMDFTALANPRYRIYLFLNPNGVGFIAAMTGLSLLDYLLRRLASWRQWLSPISLMLLGLLLSCGLLCVATKSRTATLAFLVGIILRLYLSLGFTRVFILLTLGLLVVAIIAGSMLAEVGERIADIFQLQHRQRSMTGGTGRFVLWGLVISNIWLPHFFLGVGPGQHGVILQSYGDYLNAHNGILMNLAETGVLGTLPLVAILVSCGKAMVRHLRNPAMHFAIALVACGLVESLAEVMLFSMGNPGSLMFMLAVAVLCSADPQESPPASHPG
jgi:O-antigen ligase